MLLTEFSLAAVSAGSGMFAGVFAFLAIALRGRDARLRNNGREPVGQCAFLFRDDVLVDLSDDARIFLDASGYPGTPRTFSDLGKHLSRHFPGFPEARPKGPLFLRSDGSLDDGLLEIQPKGVYTRVEITEKGGSAADTRLQARLQKDLDLLNRAVDSAPAPIWQESVDGDVTWTNKAYLDLCERMRRTPPDEKLFDLPVPSDDRNLVQRVRLEGPQSDMSCWYELTTRPSGNGWMRYATSIDAVVHAETTQRNFVQTLAKTFAHLPTGLAIFDRNRCLALFNPAMVDLTSLSAEFLGSRPNLMSFFDSLREARIMPEPKDYTSWRARLAELVAAASDDRYCETWTLPSGLTYRITGRPHPDGAIAFLIEDISSEVSLTRRFRSEMIVSQGVLDALDDAVAVFSQQGSLTATNAAYRQLWASDPKSSFSEHTVLDATRLWQKLCHPNGVWAEIREFVLYGQDRAPWEFDLTKQSGEHLFCYVDPIASGATLLRFRRAAAAGKPIRQAIDATQTVA